MKVRILFDAHEEIIEEDGKLTDEGFDGLIDSLMEFGENIEIEDFD